MLLYSASHQVMLQKYSSSSPPLWWKFWFTFWSSLTRTTCNLLSSDLPLLHTNSPSIKIIQYSTWSSPSYHYIGSSSISLGSHPCPWPSLLQLHHLQQSEDLRSLSSTYVLLPLLFLMACNSLPECLGWVTPTLSLPSTSQHSLFL